MGAGNGPLSPPPPSSVPDHAADAASDTGLAQILTLGAMPLKGGRSISPCRSMLPNPRNATFRRTSALATAASRNNGNPT